MVKFTEEAASNDLSDDELKEAVGALHEGIKRLTEARAEDEELKSLKDKAKKMEDERYNFDIKDLARKLKAARKVAKLRGIVFNLPKIEGE